MKTISLAWIAVILLISLLVLTVFFGVWLVVKTRKKQLARQLSATGPGPDSPKTIWERIAAAWRWDFFAEALGWALIAILLLYPVGVLFGLSLIANIAITGWMVVAVFAASMLQSYVPAAKTTGRRIMVIAIPVGWFMIVTGVYSELRQAEMEKAKRNPQPSVTERHWTMWCPWLDSKGRVFNEGRFYPHPAEIIEYKPHRIRIDVVFDGDNGQKEIARFVWDKSQNPNYGVWSQNNPAKTGRWDIENPEIPNPVRFDGNMYSSGHNGYPLHFILLASR